MIELARENYPPSPLNGQIIDTDDVHVNEIKRLNLYMLKVRRVTKTDSRFVSAVADETVTTTAKQVESLYREVMDGQ